MLGIRNKPVKRNVIKKKARYRMRLSNQQSPDMLPNLKDCLLSTEPFPVVSRHVAGNTTGMVPALEEGLPHT
jgi:hypothetical protein